MPPFDPRSQRGFSLVELLIALVVLAILAAVVLPRIGDLTAGSRESALSGDLQRVRTALELYKVRHDGLAPDERIVAQLTGLTNRDGDVLSAPEGPDTVLVPDESRVRGPTGGGRTVRNASQDGRSPLRRSTAVGPFLKTRFPVNPVNELASVRVVDTLPEAADGTTGWIYVRTSGRFRANVPGLSSAGRPYLDL